MNDTSAARAAALSTGYSAAPVRNVCAGLTLALVVLALRIAAVW
jgi:hypothetical protein